MHKVMKKRIRNAVAKRASWTIAGGAAAMLASSATKRALEVGWRAAAKQDPPRRPGHKGASWTSVLLWTAGSAALISVASMLADHASRRALAQVTGWREPRA